MEMRGPPWGSVKAGRGDRRSCLLHAVVDYACSMGAEGIEGYRVERYPRLYTYMGSPLILTITPLVDSPGSAASGASWVCRRNFLSIRVIS